MNKADSNFIKKECRLVQDLLDGMTANQEKSHIGRNTRGILSLLVFIAFFLSCPLACKKKPYHDRTIAELIRDLDDEKSYPEKYLILRELGKRGSKATLAVPQLLKLLRDSNKKLRYSAALALAEIGCYLPPKTITPLSIATKDPHPPVRKYAIYALANMDSSASSAALAIVSRLKDDDKDVRSAAAWALFKIAPKDALVVTTLKRVLKDEDRNVRDMATFALAKIAPKEKETLPALMLAIKNPVDDFRKEVVKLFAFIGPKAVPSLLKVLATEKEWWIRASVIKALGNIGPEAKKAIPAIKKALADENDEVRKAAKEALKKIQRKK